MIYKFNPQGFDVIQKLIGNGFQLAFLGWGA